MIDIDEKDFLEYLEKYANKEISMTQLIKELETDYRTINNKIIETSIDNSNLYYKIILNHAYKQKSRSDIDFEALMIYILKQGITIEQAIDIFNVSRRTIQRRVNEIKDSNPSLYKLFKDTVGREAKKITSPELQERIDKLEYKDVIIGEINDEREKHLLNIEEKFNSLLDTGMSKEQAANEMGYKYNYMRKVLNELYRIKIEKNVKEQAKSSNEFRRSLSDMSNYSKIETSIANNDVEDKNMKQDKKIESEQET